MSKPEDTGAVEIIRQGRRPSDENKEQVVLLDRTEGMKRFLEPLLPMGGVRYVVPKGQFDRAVPFDGAMLEVRVADTGESIQLYPKIRIVGMADHESPAVAGLALAAALHGHLQTQIPRLREVLAGVFSDFVGLSASSKVLDGIVDHVSDGALEILKPVRSKFGIEIEWILEPEPIVAAWIQRLQMLIAQETKQSFNTESRTAQFNLTFSARIISALPSGLHLVQRRLRAGLSPEQELQRILDRIHVVLNPAFGVFGDGLRIWTYPRFWPLVEAAFNLVVGPAIAEEFGYKMEFRDFRRERTPAELDVLGLLENPERLLQEFKAAEQFCLKLEDEERTAVVDNDYNMRSPHVIRIQSALKSARERLEEAKAKMEAASRGYATMVGPEDSHRARQLLKAFHDRLHLQRPELLLEASEDPIDEKDK